MSYSLTGPALILGAALCQATAPTPWEAYLAHPTPQNAAKVVEISYSTGRADEARANDLSLLAVQVESADRYAVQLAFRVLRKSDGHTAETLSIMLGRVIRVNPRLFLEELKTARLPDDWLGGVVGNLGPEYLDRMLAQRYEAERRIAAIGSVRESRLKLLREACVKELERIRENGGAD